jgi:hypothetical protein
MRITIQVVCDDAVEAQKVIGKLAAENTWVDPIEQVKTDTKARDARIDKIMGSSAAGAEQSGSNDGATGAPRPNISPGEPSITKIGADAKAFILTELKCIVGASTGRVPEHFGHKYKEHLKLLWKRGEIKFDGTEYYL